MKTVGGRLKPEFAVGPFTIAFQYGFWLLLDELNLASGEVLASLENALDTGRLTVADDTNSAVREQVRGACVVSGRRRWLIAAHVRCAACTARCVCLADCATVVSGPWGVQLLP